MVINAARGPIIDTEAALAAAGSGKVAELVVDCWEGEPAVNPRLLAQAAIATPHIAGYSIEGKQRASAAVVAAALDFFGVQPDCPVSAARIKALTSRVMANAPSSDPTHEITPANILASYNPLADTASMRSGFTPERFESLRNHYTLRHEL